MIRVEQGQRAIFPLTGAGKLMNGAQSVARGESPDVRSWQVTLAPVFVSSVGTNIDGQPARRPAPIGAGHIGVQLTWGGGGVSYQTRFDWPVNGTSFAVSGDNVMVEAFPTDLATVFTEATKPSVVGWLKSAAVPTAIDPLIIFAALPNAVASPILPFARALVLAKDAAAATATVAFSTTLGVVQTIFVPATGGGITRIPIPLQAETVTVTPSAGGVQASWELSFT